MNATPVATAGMLIRRPIGEVYEAFIDPEVTARFWFSHGNTRLDADEPVRWTWAMYGASADIEVRDLQPNRRILIDWSSEGEPATTIEWTFRELPDGTYVEVQNYGFTGDGDAIVAQALDSVGGFTLLMAGAKAWLEHGIELNLVRDRYPDGL